MDSAAKNLQYSQAFRDLLLLRYEPIALKLIEDEKDIPAGAIRPNRDLGRHMALCQAFALARRDRKIIYMDKYSEWCWNPLIGFGLVSCPEGSEAFELIAQKLGIKDIEAAREFFAKFPRLPERKYTGIAVAPLSLSTFEPNLVLVYCNNAQLRSLVWAVKNITGKLVSTQLDAIDSCVYACVPPVLTDEFHVTLPDMGEHERAAADENEIIFSVPAGRIGALLEGLRFFEQRKMGYPQLIREMPLDFERPPFYNELFGLWGLDQGAVWTQ